MNSGPTSSLRALGLIILILSVIGGAVVVYLGLRGMNAPILILGISTILSGLVIGLLCEVIATMGENIKTLHATLIAQQVTDYEEEEALTD